MSWNRRKQKEAWQPCVSAAARASQRSSKGFRRSAMTNKIEKVAVLGAGVMGAQLAAHLSNAGVPSLLFDISQDIAAKGKEAALNLKPAAFYNPQTAELITPC